MIGLVIAGTIVAVPTLYAGVKAALPLIAKTFAKKVVEDVATDVVEKKIEDKVEEKTK